MTPEERIHRTAVLRQMIDSDGWKIVSEYLDERRGDSVSALTRLMEKTPEKLTTRTAFAHGLRIRAFSELVDWLDGEVRLGDSEAEKILRQSQKDPQGRGNR